MKDKNETAICLDDGVCMVIEDETYQIINCLDGKAFRCTLLEGKLNETQIDQYGKIEDLI